jgi:thymidylate synthase
MALVDLAMQAFVNEILDTGVEINTRNSVCKRVMNQNVTFKETPLLTLRKTAWKSALREMEWFLSGSCKIDDLHPSVHKWWKPFCQIDGHSLPHNYGRALRNIYNPTGGEYYEPKVKKIEDKIFDIKEFTGWNGELEPIEGTGKFIGFEDTNHHGYRFRVFKKTKDKYLLQFLDTGTIVESSSANFKNSRVKDPYSLTFLGVGCYGIVNKKDYTYYKEAYNIWASMMNRCYNKDRHHYKWYGAKGIVVSSRWKCFEFFIKDMCLLTGFEEWVLSLKGDKKDRLQLDKDYLKANYYGKDSCVFLPKNLNVGISNMDRVQNTPRRRIKIDQVEYLINAIKEHPYSRRTVATTWIPQHVQAGLINPTNCHGTMIQAFVNPDNSLHLTMYQRSSDMILGMPHNWIQYWALLMYLA